MVISQRQSCSTYLMLSLMTGVVTSFMTQPPSPLFCHSPTNLSLSAAAVPALWTTQPSYSTTTTPTRLYSTTDSSSSSSSISSSSITNDTTNTTTNTNTTATPSTANEAAALTEFMAKAHEEKLAAIARTEAKYKEQITQLQEKIMDLERLASQKIQTSSNSFAFPATNKDLTNKVETYRVFLADYMVKAHQDKARAVKKAEDELKAKYEAIIAKLKERGST